MSATRLIELRNERDVVLARKAAGQAMDEIAASAIRRTRFVTAISEIARNAVVHGGGGTLELRRADGPTRIEAVCRDRGPGIADVEQAMRDGFSTRGSLGRGLGGAKRLTDGFAVESAPGQGTTVRLYGRAR